MTRPVVKAIEVIALRDIDWLSQPGSLPRGWFIAKVQLPVSHPTTGLALVYDRARACEFKTELSLAVRAAIGTDLKGYFHARFLGTTFEIGPRTADQPW